ncbi:hypothetical protein WJX74_004743 [Apatococcus lobatus]|uniref:Uncharacterized protein n=1 Tax=Apatococcus lobatus TaxID=904363 RepID=A0AAW1RBD4_9CHLO
MLAAQAGTPSSATPQYQLPHLYTVDQDIASQRVALASLYSAAGGPSWVFPYQFGSGGDIPRYAPPELLAYFGNASLTAVQSELQLVNGIFGPSSIGQQARLGLWGIGVLKSAWFAPGFSYCSWAGVTCCMTGNELALAYCRYGLQSVAWLSLTGLTGPFPKLPASLAHIMQVFAIDQTNLSQPCMANSRQFGGNDLPISVGKLNNFSEYTACLPNCLAFESNTLHKVVYKEKFLCPAVRWNRQIPDDGTLNAPGLLIPRPSILPSLINSDDNSSFVVKVDPKLYSYVGCVCIDSDSDAVSKVDAYDAFIIAFHEALDAANFAVGLQQALLTLPWPADVLSSKHAEAQFRYDGENLFKGLRVRMAMHTAIPAAIEVHTETGKMEYMGELVDLTEAISRLPAGHLSRHASHSSMQHIESHHAATSEQAVVFIDQGRFGLTEFSAAPGSFNESLAVTGGVHIVEVVPSELACRAVTFPALDPALKVGPSFFDAPGASAAALPGRSLAESHDVDVTIVFCSSCQMKALMAICPEAARAASAKFKSCLRTTLRLTQGYECQEKEGTFMLAFEKPHHAAEWAILLNLTLLE